jgi:hypothetical protein
MQSTIHNQVADNEEEEEWGLVEDDVWERAMNEYYEAEDRKKAAEKDVEMMDVGHLYIEINVDVEMVDVVFDDDDEMMDLF